MSEERDKAKPPEPNSDAGDVVVLGDTAADGKSVGVVRFRGGGVEVGRVAPLEEGRPIVGEVVKLTPRAETPRVCDVTVEYSPSETRTAPERIAATRHGPAQVASAAYRENWDRIWAKKDPGPAN